MPRAEVEQTGQVGDERVLDGQELRMCLHHPGWLVGKLEHIGPVKREADLALSDDPLPRMLETTVRQNAHVLRPLQPPGSHRPHQRGEATQLPDHAQDNANESKIGAPEAGGAADAFSVRNGPPDREIGD